MGDQGFLSFLPALRFCDGPRKSHVGLLWLVGWLFVCLSPLLPAGGNLSVPNTLCASSFCVNSIDPTVSAWLRLSNLRTRLLNNFLKTLVKNILVPSLSYFDTRYCRKNKVHKAGKVSYQRIYLLLALSRLWVLSLHPVCTILYSGFFIYGTIIYLCH